MCLVQAKTRKLMMTKKTPAEWGKKQRTWWKSLPASIYHGSSQLSQGLPWKAVGLQQCNATATSFLFPLYPQCATWAVTLPMSQQGHKEERHRCSWRFMSKAQWFGFPQSNCGYPGEWCTDHISALISPGTWKFQQEMVVPRSRGLRGQDEPTSILCCSHQGWQGWEMGSLVALSSLLPENCNVQQYQPNTSSDWARNLTTCWLLNILTKTNQNQVDYPCTSS